MDSKKVREKQIGRFLEVDMAQSGEYQLKRPQDKRICIRDIKREKKAFKH